MSAAPGAGGELRRGHAAGEGVVVVGVGVEAVGGAVLRGEGVQVVAAALGEGRLGGDQAGDDDGVAEVVGDRVGGDADLRAAADGDDLAVTDDEYAIGDRGAIAGPDAGGAVGVRLRGGGAGERDRGG